MTGLLRLQHATLRGLLALLLGLGIVCAWCLSPAGADTAQAATVKLSKASITLVEGDTYALKLKGATASQVRWSSTKSSVASVSKGTVKAKKAGSATIKAKYKKKTYKCSIKVNSLIYQASQTNLTLKKGESASVDIAFNGSGYVRFNNSANTIVEPKWSGNWSNNATQLNIKALKVGTAQIKMTADVTPYNFYINVTVLPNITVQFPNLPVSVRDGSSRNQWRITVEDLSYKIEENYSNGYQLIVDLRATKRAVIGDGKGAAYINYKIYDEYGAVVNSGYFFKSNIADGETYKVSKTIYLDEQAGNFRVEFCDHDDWL